MSSMGIMDIMGVKKVSWALALVNDEVGTAICWAATKWETFKRWVGKGTVSNGMLANVGAGYLGMNNTKLLREKTYQKA